MIHSSGTSPLNATIANLSSHEPSSQTSSTINMTTEFKHLHLGSVVGLDLGKTIAYRGLKYAELEHTFAEPTLFTNPGRPTLDATSYG